MIDWVEAAKSAYRFIGNPRRVSGDEYARRLDVCASCPQLMRRNRCGLCGCFVAFKAKLAGWDCPAQKWSVGNVATPVK